MPLRPLPQAGRSVHHACFRKSTCSLKFNEFNLRAVHNADFPSHAKGAFAFHLNLIFQSFVLHKPLVSMQGSFYRHNLGEHVSWSESAICRGGRGTVFHRSSFARKEPKIKK
jgi:hypothetical protein